MRNEGQFSTGFAKLHGVVESLQRAWKQAHEDWDDETANKIDEQHIQPIVSELNQILEMIVPMSDCVAQARRAVGPDRDR